jgi:hypothetical protein
VRHEVADSAAGQLAEPLALARHAGLVAFDRDEVAQLSAFPELLRDEHRRIEQAVVAGREERPAATRGLRHRRDVCVGEREGLLDERRDAALERGNRDRGVHVRRREHVDGVELLAVEHVADVPVHALDAVAIGELAGRRDVQVAEGNRLATGRTHVGQMRVGDDAAADDADVQASLRAHALGFLSLPVRVRSRSALRAGR